MPDIDPAVLQESPARRLLLTPDDFSIPHWSCFTPSELAHHMRADAKSIIRLIEDGDLEAFPFRIRRMTDGSRRISWKIPYVGIVHYFLRMQGAMN